MPIQKTSAKGQVVIPADIRARVGLRPGGRVLVTIHDHRILLEPVPDDPIGAMRGYLKGGPSLTKALLRERRRERGREEAKGARLVRPARVRPGRARRRAG